MAFSLTVIILSILLKWCQSEGCSSGDFCPKASALEATGSTCTAPDPPTFSPSVRELDPNEDYEITITYQVPQKSGCLSLAALDILYRLKDQKEWKIVTVDVSQNTVNIEYIGTGIYMIMMRATNNEGITSESEVKAIEVGKEKSSGDYTTVYIIAAAIGIPLWVATIVGIVIACKRRRAKKRAAIRKAANLVPVISVTPPTVHFSAPPPRVEPPANTPDIVITPPTVSPIVISSDEEAVDIAPSPVVIASDEEVADSGIPPMVQYESLFQWASRQQIGVRTHCVPMTSRQLGFKGPKPRQSADPDGCSVIPGYKLPTSEEAPAVASGGPLIPGYEGLQAWNPKPDKVAKTHQHVGVERNSSTAIHIGKFEDFVRNQKTAIAQQFTDVKRCVVDTDVMIKGGTGKNADLSHKIHPYAHNRVVLHDDGTHADGDYINASYIVGYDNEPKAYIAAQAPVPQTVNQFWRMIWQNDVNRIVMLINVEENNSQKMNCPRYWPRNKGDALVYGNYVLRLADVTEYAIATVRAIRIQKKDESRVVFHFLFNHWDDMSTPLFGSLPLISLIKLVHEIDTLGRGPLVVHCRTGVGRTGMFIALDILLQQIAEEDYVDVFGCVKSLRKQRINMIQDEDQYYFLYDAILENMVMGEPEYDIQSLVKLANTESEEDMYRNIELKRQHSVLLEFASKPTDLTKTGVKDANTSKNRDLHIIPADCDRPYLYTTVPGRTDYINAVFVDSFRRHNQFIVTQMPLPDTQVDFWRLVYDYDIQCIVMLNQLDTHDERCKQYWDDQRTMTFGPISVQRTEFSRPSRDIECREFTVRLTSNEWNATPTKTLTVTHYRLLNWPNNKLLPDDNSGLQSLINIVTNWRKTRSELRGLERNDMVIVHCMDGAARSGMFCAACHTVEQIATNKHVNVLSAARFVCARRSQFLQSMTEYLYLYTNLCEYAARMC